MNGKKRGKASESELGAMMRSRYHFFVHKWRDRGYVSCPHCGEIVKVCPRCRQDMLLAKAQTYPDFLIAYAWSFMESKNSLERFGKSDISPNQYKVMENCRDGWLWLEMGGGRAPNGRSAFLIPWQHWLEIEHNLEEKGVSSIVYEKKSERGKSPVANELLAGYRLEWEDGGWAIPLGHIFWSTHTPNTEAVYETEG